MSARLAIVGASLLVVLGAFFWIEIPEPDSLEASGSDKPSSNVETEALVGANGEGGAAQDGPRAADLLSLDGLLKFGDVIDPGEYVAALLRLERGPEVEDEMIAAYARLAGNPDAEQSRRAILDAPFSTDPASAAVTLVLKAVAGDPTPPGSDPHWDFARDQCVALMSQAGVRSWVSDVLLMKPNPRARRFVATSLLRYGAERDVSEKERMAITQDLIDAFHAAKNDLTLREEIIDGISAVAGPEVAHSLADPLGEQSEVDDAADTEDAAEVRELVTQLLHRAREADVEIVEFEEIIASLKILDPIALQVVENTAPILQTSEKARELLEKAKSGS